MNSFLYQLYFETKLEDMLSRYPDVQIMRGRELIAFEQDNELAKSRQSVCTVRALVKVALLDQHFFSKQVSYLDERSILVELSREVSKRVAGWSSAMAGTNPAAIANAAPTIAMCILARTFSSGSENDAATKIHPMSETGRMPRLIAKHWIAG
jgi:hypothetical protein